MIVPEKSNRVAKVVIPSYIFKGGILALAFLAVLATIMVLDYANVMNQINENKQLKVENRQLRQSVQVFKTKMVTIENTLDRVKTFVTKLRIITNIEDNSGPPPSTLPMNPVSAPAIPQNPGPPLNNVHDKDTTHLRKNDSFSFLSKAYAEVPTTQVDDNPDDLTDEAKQAQNAGKSDRNDYESQRQRRLTLLAALMTETPQSFTITDSDTSVFVRTEFEKLDSAYEEVNKFALATELETQDVMERLGEKRALLASTPTRIPTLGYITSDYGIRVSPYDGRRKMHEGIDIANRYGSDIIAPADGTVIFAGVKPGYGKMVILDHGNGIETRYAHNSNSYIQAGDRVKRGQKIAAVGSSGHSTGPHCHYEVHASGLPVDPCWYILDYSHLCRR